MLLAATAALLAAAAWLGLAYRRELAAHEARVAAGSRVVDTRCGPIEFAEAGRGPALLVIHGSGGGFDQGLALGAAHAARGWRVIAPSRFGYLRTPMPDGAGADASPAAQADHHACLLDALGVRDVALMGVSAGALSALQFAARHPQRTRALVLAVPAVYRPGLVPPPAWAERAMLALLGADLPFWLAARFAPDLVRRIVLATPPADYAAAGADEQRRADALMAQIQPVHRRARGLAHDTLASARAARVALETIRAPTLVIAARNDGFGLWDAARYTAAQIAGARFVGFDDGGHLMLGHERERVDAVEAFLREAIIVPTGPEGAPHAR